MISETNVNHLSLLSNKVEPRLVFRNKEVNQRLTNGHLSILQAAVTGAIGATGAVVPGHVVGVEHDDVIASVTTPTGIECK